jgi:transcriptional regulator with XRE-family HTH domain
MTAIRNGAELTAAVLGERLKAAIGASGMSQQAVAEAIGMDPTALSRVLSGLRNLSTLEFARICDSLGTSPLGLLAEIPDEAITAEPHPEGSPVLAAAAGAILSRRLAATHGSGDPDARRAAILLDALPDAAAALEAAAPLIAAADRKRIRELEDAVREFIGYLSFRADLQPSRPIAGHVVQRWLRVLGDPS